ncbi:MAG: L-aspartate oxidase [Rhodobacteraceae bacterium]|nr:L-aspartate oxidase [Paracoccaceae bacterium]
MRETTTKRVVIVGAGLGALYAALMLAPHPVVVISPEPLGEGASSAWAQGGIAAAMDLADSPEAHASDTEHAGAGTVDTGVAQMVTQAARDHILQLTTLGTPFDRTEDGSYVMSREAAHSFARVVRVKGDQAGAEIMAALIEKVKTASHIQVIEGVMATRLLTTNRVVDGVVLRSSQPGGSESVTLRGSAYLLAGGGSGGLYALTTNPHRIRGEVIGMAARAGAVVADAEFVQFHPTAIDVGEDPAPLATEALRGEGAVLLNTDGERFMQAVHPNAELAPRDVVARAIFAQTQAGKRPVLDTRDVLGAGILEQFPSVADACLRNGLNPVSQPIPVAAAAHYHMGGIAVDQRGRASLGNLWVCGEASSTGLHGANRLASNGLLEALVYARICALDIAAGRTETAEARVACALGQADGSAPLDAIRQLRQTMTRHVGVLRDADGLKTALRTIDTLERAHGADDSFRNMCATATMIAAAALLREESRGAHSRTDFPDPRPEPGQRSRITLTEALALRDQCVKETS